MAADGACCEAGAWGTMQHSLRATCMGWGYSSAGAPGSRRLSLMRAAETELRGVQGAAAPCSRRHSMMMLARGQQGWARGA